MRIRSSTVRRASTAISLSMFMIFGWSGAAHAQAIAPAQSQITVPPPVPPQIPVTLPRCEKEGQKVAVFIRTGVNLTNIQSLSTGLQDQHWRVTLPNATISQTFETDHISAWLNPIPLGPARWIQPSNAGNPNSSLPAGLYRYKLLFNTPADPYLYSSFSITGTIAADNSITAIKLDNQPFLPPPNCTNCFAAAINQTLSPVNPLLINSGPSHVLEIDVNNAGAYSGLYVNLTATAVCSRCTIPRPPYHQVSSLPSRQSSLFSRKQAPSC